MIESLRREGNFLYNRNEMYQRDEKKIFCRQPRKDNPRSEKHYMVCPNCKGYISKLTLRRHYRQCSSTKKGTREICIMSRKIQGDVGIQAGTILRNEVFPLLRDDEVTNVIRYDSIILLYGNQLCLKYRQKHLQKMIRAKLRLLGRFLIEARKMNSSVKNLEDVFEPIRFTNVVAAVNNVAELDDSTGRYKAPATASLLGTLLKQVARTFIIECIKNKKVQAKSDAEDFLRLMEADLSASINTTVAENQLEMKRNKKIDLPLTSDINLLKTYLDKNRSHYCAQLEIEYSFNTWMNLASHTLISILVFNRRRPGEIERTHIDDFKGYQEIGSRQKNTHYVRFIIRGKRGRSVPVLIDLDILKCLQIILKHRENSGVSDNNPFVFGIPGSTYYTHLRATDLIRKYSEACGAKKPALLRGTLLRKHIATLYAQKNLPDQEVGFLLDHLGHERGVHLSHYRQPVAKRDIQVTEFLEQAQGK